VDLRSSTARTLQLHAAKGTPAIMARALTVFVLVVTVTAMVGCGAAGPDELALDEAVLGETVDGGSDDARGTDRAASVEREQGEPSSYEPHRDDVVLASATFDDASWSSDGASSATGPDGSRYVARIFSGRFRIGTTMLQSRGGADVLLARIRPEGTVAWARAVGSKGDESNPRVSFSDDSVKLVAMTDGAVDCGQGPLNTWSSETFFLCTFEPDGTPINSASFPTGRWP